MVKIHNFYGQNICSVGNEGQGGTPQIMSDQLTLDFATNMSTRPPPTDFYTFRRPYLAAFITALLLYTSGSQLDYLRHTYTGTKLVKVSR